MTLTIRDYKYAFLGTTAACLGILIWNYLLFPMTTFDLIFEMCGFFIITIILSILDVRSRLRSNS